MYNFAFTIKIHKSFGFPIKIWSDTCAKRGRKSNMEIRESFLWLIGNKWFLMTLIGAYQLSRASSILTGHRSSIKQFSIIKQFTMGKNNFWRNIHVIPSMYIFFQFLTATSVWRSYQLLFVQVVVIKACHLPLSQFFLLRPVPNWKTCNSNSWPKLNVEQKRWNAGNL